jgi:2-polyprenyl-3-methyl-5-hydroxy-6-metoxy-1,4-benzoquinol methylase
MQKDKNWYNEAYAKSTEYRKEPEDSIYIGVWNKALELINRERVVDLGCGSGQFAKLLIKKNKRFVYAVDYSNEAISIAKGLNPEYSDKFVVKNLLKDYKLPAHDLIICFEVLEHITEDLSVVRKIQSGKRFIFSVPNYDYKSHVRKFETEEDILSRYGNLLDIHKIYPIKMSDKNIIWLCDSVKK